MNGFQYPFSSDIQHVFLLHPNLLSIFIFVFMKANQTDRAQFNDRVYFDSDHLCLNISTEDDITASTLYQVTHMFIVDYTGDGSMNPGLKYRIYQ